MLVLVSIVESIGDLPSTFFLRNRPGRIIDAAMDMLLFMKWSDVVLFYDNSFRECSSFCETDGFGIVQLPFDVVLHCCIRRRASSNF